MVKKFFKNNYKFYGNLVIDEVMIKWIGRFLFKKYLLLKFIKKGIKIWMRCDLVNVYMIDFEIYFKKGIQVFEYGLGMKLLYD